MPENAILIVTENKNIIHKNVMNYRIDIMQSKVNKYLLDTINNNLYDEYKYIIFEEEIKDVNDIKHYCPLNNISNCKNRVFVNQLLINGIILNHIGNIVNKRYLWEVTTLLVYLIKNNLSKKEFYFMEVLEHMEKINNLKLSDILYYKNKIYAAIADIYCYKNSIRKIEYAINKQGIIKKVIYKFLGEIMPDIQKNINEELVFKEFVGIAI